MLTVKVYDEDDSRAVYTCDSYRLVPPGVEFPGDSCAYDYPRVILMDDDGDVRAVIKPATTSTIYVMNIGGRTVDTMRFLQYAPGKGAAGVASTA